MKKILLLIIVSLFLCFQQVQSKNPIPCGYIEWTKIKDCDINVYYKVDFGKLNFIVESDNVSIPGNYKIYLFDIFGRKLMEKEIKNPTSFYQDNLKSGLYYIKISNDTTVLNRVIPID